jgi:hypothetical protein
VVITGCPLLQRLAVECDRVNANGTTWTAHGACAFAGMREVPSVDLNFNTEL